MRTQDYMELLKIMILIIIKINEEFANQERVVIAKIAITTLHTATKSIFRKVR